MNSKDQQFNAIRSLQARIPQFTTTRLELALRYFGEMANFNLENKGIVSLLSDVQEILANYHGGESGAHYQQILNDIKCILVNDMKNRETLVSFHTERGEATPPCPKRKPLKPVQFFTDGLYWLKLGGEHQEVNYVKKVGDKYHAGNAGRDGENFDFRFEVKKNQIGEKF